ncbi:hypothetical protein [Pleomorphomonas sp. PLEO]|uniref:hypothetical protein n=1 Tax=Pleomorphomonas sp. PLEO TaxID=3239306 RepID=UPI00351E4424
MGRRMRLEQKENNQPEIVSRAVRSPAVAVASGEVTGGFRHEFAVMRGGEGETYIGVSLHPA